ncbi:MAG: hypothetical protein Q4B22_09240 [Eubacteriales bacterium]|nr:hypothetical protein [Eubacteriales bacterium]
MLDFDEEIKKFRPCLDVENVEEAIRSQDLTDIVDLIREMESGYTYIPERER